MAFVVARRYASADPLSLTDPNLTGLIVIIEVLAAAMVVCWIAALVRLWRQRAVGWFAAVLILHVVGLGIVGMAPDLLPQTCDDVAGHLRDLR